MYVFWGRALGMRKGSWDKEEKNGTIGGKEVKQLIQWKNAKKRRKGVENN